MSAQKELQNLEARQTPFFLSDFMKEKRIVRFEEARKKERRRLAGSEPRIPLVAETQSTVPETTRVRSV